MGELFRTLEELWLYDIRVLTNPWILYTVIPAVIYSVFMLIKWAVITCPIWVPLRLVADSLNQKSK